MRTLNNLLVCAIALVVPLCTWAQTEIEPNEGAGNATPVTYNTAMVGSSGVCSPTNNTIDWFTITPPSQGVLRINTAMSNTGGTDLSATLRVRNNSQTVLATYTATAGANNVATNNQFLFNCQGTGIYYIDIQNPNTTVCTNYTFTYDMIAPVYANDAEPNAGAGDADVANAATNYDGHLNFTYDNNSDWYSVQALNDGVLNVTMRAEHAGSAATDTLELRLRNNSQTVLTTWKIGIGANGTPSSQSFTRTCTGTEAVYYLEVVNAEACGTSYRFSYTITPPLFADDAEDNDGAGAAIITAAGTNYTGRIAFEYDDNTDWYRVQAPNDGVLIVAIQAEHAGTSATGTLGLRLRNNSQTVIETWVVNVGPNSTTILQTFSHTCTGTENVYYLEAYTPSVCGVSYQLSYTVDAPVFADDVENNDGAGSAIPATAGTNYNGRLDFNYDNNTDWYSVLAPNDGVMSATIRAEHAGSATGNTMTLRLRNNAQTVIETWTVNIGASSTPGTQTFAHTCTGTEAVYYLEVVAPTTCGVSYRLNYTVAAPVYADDVENNDGAGAAILIDLNAAPADGRLEFEYDDNTDWYRINHTGGPIVLLTEAESAGASGTMQVRIRNASQTVLETAIVPVGGASVPASTSYNSASLVAGLYYLEPFDPTVCGVSYRLGCYDADADGTCNAFDLCPGGPEPGTACNDNDPCTTGDVIQAGCNCAGTFQDSDSDGTCDFSDLCSGGPEPGTACNDNNTATVNDIIQANCLCAGTLLGNDCNGVPGGPAVPGTSCNDNNACTTGDVFDANCLCAGTFADADGDGTCDANDLCPGGPEPGTACNDNNAATINDIIQPNCSCAGTLLGNDCNGVPGGPAVPGTSCNDNNACTTGDVFDANCLCAGTFADADGDGTCDANDLCSGGPEPGSACNDNNACTTGDVIGANCLCAGTLVDTDGDGVCDANDSCPTVVGQIGSTCNDGNANTTGDMLNANCQCVGTPIGGCTENLTLSVKLDGNPMQTTWTLLDAATESVTIASGGFMAGQANTTVLVPICVPVGCYHLRVLDSGNNGITAGGYVLTDASNRRIIDASLGSFSSVSEINTGANPNRFFCVPISNLKMQNNWCDRTNLLVQSPVYCNSQPGANGYQFWIYDAHGTYNRRVLLPTPSLVPSSLLTSPVPVNVNLNIRVRSRIGSTFGEFGPACRIKFIPNNSGSGFRSMEFSDETVASMTIYPNPNRDGQLTISMEGLEIADGANVDVVIYDLLGKPVVTETAPVAEGMLNHRMDLAGRIGQGMYVVNVTIDGKLYTQRLVMQ